MNESAERSAHRTSLGARGDTLHNQNTQNPCDVDWSVNGITLVWVIWAPGGRAGACQGAVRRRSRQPKSSTRNAIKSGATGRFPLLLALSDEKERDKGMLKFRIKGIALAHSVSIVLLSSVLYSQHEKLWKKTKCTFPYREILFKKIPKLLQLIGNIN
jgi:hypothetical protein